MKQVLVDVTGHATQVYLDDIIVDRCDWDTHLFNLESVLDRLNRARLTLRLVKCEFFREKVNYSGCIVSREGLSPQPDKVTAIKKIVTPVRVRDVQSFLGLANYYRRHIAGYAVVAKPLTDLTKVGKGVKNSKVKVQWNDKAEQSFKELKRCLTHDIELAFPDFT